VKPKHIDFAAPSMDDGGDAAMKREKAEPQKIARAQWDFSTCPEAELSFCVAYE